LDQLDHFITSIFGMTNPRSLGEIDIEDDDGAAQKRRLPATPLSVDLFGSLRPEALRPRLSAGLLINAGAIDNPHLATAQSVAVFIRCHMQTGARARNNRTNAIGYFLINAKVLNPFKTRHICASAFFRERTNDCGIQRG
jgi:hypothetical protein